MAKTPAVREYYEYIRRYGAKVRVAPSVPLKMLVFDGEAAVVGIDPDEPSIGAWSTTARRFSASQ